MRGRCKRERDSRRCAVRVPRLPLRALTLPLCPGLGRRKAGAGAPCAVVKPHAHTGHWPAALLARLEMGARLVLLSILVPSSPGLEDKN